MTFDGDYNVSPAPQSGRKDARVRCAQRRALPADGAWTWRAGRCRCSPTAPRDESPSFAPNGRIILYATEVDGRGVLAAVSSDGRVKQRLSVQAADVREPSWGPFIGN